MMLFRRWKDIFRMERETKRMWELLKLELRYTFRMYANILRIHDDNFRVDALTMIHFACLFQKYIFALSAHESFNLCHLSKLKLIAQTETLPRIFSLHR